MFVPTEIKMQEVCDYINKVDQGVSAVVSNDAGRLDFLIIIYLFLFIIRIWVKHKNIIIINILHY